MGAAGRRDGGRWRERFGDAGVGRLTDALSAVRERAGRALPRFLPILNAKGFFSEPVIGAPSTARGANRDLERDDLPALLSHALLAFTLEYEAESVVSLPIAANLLRVLGVEPVSTRDLPSVAGVAKEAVAMSAAWLERADLVVQEVQPGGRGKVVFLTSEGVDAQRAHLMRRQVVERQWEEQLGSGVVDELRAALETILSCDSFADSMITPAGGWRGRGRYARATAGFLEDPRRALPRHPMVLHRGGWPDGS